MANCGHVGPKADDVLGKLSAWGQERVATFYLLPSRPRLGQQLAGVLEHWLPGLTWKPADWPALTETLTALVDRESDTFVVFEDDLPAGAEPQQALIDGFGAEPEDQVIPCMGLTRTELPLPHSWEGIPTAPPSAATH